MGKIQGSRETSLASALVGLTFSFQPWFLLTRVCQEALFHSTLVFLNRQEETPGVVVQVSRSLTEQWADICLTSSEPKYCYKSRATTPRCASRVEKAKESCVGYTTSCRVRAVLRLGNPCPGIA